MILSLVKREIWLDIAKGFSIIFVVMGHSGDILANHYLSWFRMPLFFILSGFLFKPVIPQNFFNWAKKKTKNMLIPYASYGILITLIFFVFEPTIIAFIKNILKLAYGGIVLQGQYGVFWFITCLLMTQLVFGYLSRYSTKVQIIVIIFAYVLAHLGSILSFSKIPFPGNFDVVLITLTYYSIGYYAKEIIATSIKKVSVFLISALLWISFVILDMEGILLFELNLKYKIYHNLLLDICIPLIIAVSICSACFWLSKLDSLRYLAKLGSNSIAIMYLHIPINLLTKNLLNIDYGLLTYTIIGIAGSLIVLVLFRKSKILSRLFLSPNSRQYSTGNLLRNA